MKTMSIIIYEILNFGTGFILSKLEDYLH